jgi:hypothetical protein
VEYDFGKERNFFSGIGPHPDRTPEMALVGKTR